MYLFDTDVLSNIVKRNPFSKIPGLHIENWISPG